MEDKKIKSCPFCGHDKVSVTTHVAGNGETYVKVTCKKCWSGACEWGTDKEKVIAKWNKRAEVLD